ERQRLQTSLCDLGAAVLAEPVAAVVDARERFVDGFELAAIAVVQDVADLPIARVAGEVIGVHALVLLRITALVETLLNVLQKLRPHGLERFARLLEDGFPHGRAAESKGSARWCQRREASLPASRRRRRRRCGRARSHRASPGPAPGPNRRSRG